MTTESCHTQAVLTLPTWVLPFLAARARQLHGDAERMELAIALARENIERGTGGPFGAAIFAQESGQLISVGVNRVVPGKTSLAHAEMMAFLLAQRRLASFDLGSEGLPSCELVTSAQMCAMCYGATLWAGVRRVVCAATRDDVEGILGFDEGPLPDDWEQELAHRAIALRLGVLREDSRALLRRYAELKGIIYNSRQAFNPQ